MNYTLSLTRQAAETLRGHLLGDRSREQLAVTLCGVNRLHRELRLLVRDVILLPADAFRRQSAAHLELKPEVQAFIHARAHRHGLIEVDWHSHPGAGPTLGFSATDDHYEAAQAAYLAERMDGVPYGSVVVNDDALDGRLWLTESTKPAAAHGKPAQDAPAPAGPRLGRPIAQPLQALLVGDLARCIPLTAQRLNRAHAAFVSPIFDRQVRAFGSEVQRRLAGLRVGVIGVGGLGSALVAHLARLGVAHWVLVDPDIVELTNLNRLVGASAADAQKARPKVYVARSTIRQAVPKATVRPLKTDVFDPVAQRALKACDLLIVATDNHSSRMAANRLAVQYLIPLVHVGFNVSVDPARDSSSARGGKPDSPLSSQEKWAGGMRSVTDVSGEFAIPDLGRWCLQCAGIVDPQAAGWELASPAQRAILRQRGYVADTPAPAVGHLDGVVAALAAAEIHNLVAAFKPQHRYLTYDALRGELLPLAVGGPGPKVAALAACPVCSADAGVLGLGDLEPLPDYRRAAQTQLPTPAALSAHTLASEAAPAAAPGPALTLPPADPAAPAPELVEVRPARVRRLQEALATTELDWRE